MNGLFNIYSGEQRSVCGSFRCRSDSGCRHLLLGVRRLSLWRSVVHPHLLQHWIIAAVHALCCRNRRLREVSAAALRASRREFSRPVSARRRRVRGVRTRLFPPRIGSKHHHHRRHCQYHVGCNSCPLVRSGINPQPCIYLNYAQTYDCIRIQLYRTSFGIRNKRQRFYRSWTFCKQSKVSITLKHSTQGGREGCLRQAKSNFALMWLWSLTSLRKVDRIMPLLTICADLHVPVVIKIGSISLLTYFVCI